MRVSRFLVCLLAFGLLAACGGSSGPIRFEDGNLQGDPDPARDPQDRPAEQEPQTASDNDSASDAVDPEDPMEPFGSEPPAPEEEEGSVLDETLTETEADVIVLTGIGIRRDPTSGQRVLVVEDGVYEASDDSRTLAGVPIELSDDVQGAFVVTSGYIQETTGTTGVVGIPTDPTVLDRTGSARFDGGAVMSIILPDAGFDMRNGQSVVDVDFSNGLVTATLSDFTDISQVSGNLSDAPVDTVVLSGAAIAESGFSGGTLTASGRQSLNDVTGANQVVLSEGHFFGVTEAGDAPLEVGGLILAYGDSGQLTASFIAD